MHTPQMEVKSVANVSFHRLQVSSADARSIPTSHRNKLDVPWELRRGNDTTSCTVVRRIQHPRQGCGGTKTASRDSHGPAAHGSAGGAVSASHHHPLQPAFARSAPGAVRYHDGIAVRSCATDEPSGNDSVAQMISWIGSTCSTPTSFWSSPP